MLLNTQAAAVPEKQGSGRLEAVKNIFSFMTPYRWRFAVAIFLYSGQHFASALLTSYIMGGLSAAMVAGSAEDALRVCLGFFLGMLVFAGSVGIAIGVHVACMENASKDMKTRLFRSFVRSSAERPPTAHSGSGIAAINTDADLAARIFGNHLSAVLNSLISIFFSAAIVLVIDLRLGLLSLAIGFIALALQYRFAEPLSRIGRERLGLNAAAVSKISAFLSGGSSIRVFGMQEKVLRDFEQDNEQLRQLSFKEATISTWMDIFTSLQGWLTIVGIFGLGGYLVVSGELAISSLLMIPPLCKNLAFGMSTIGSSWASLQEPIEACMRVQAIISESDRIEALRQERSQEENRWDGDYTLQLTDLDFAYLHSEEKALKEINLSIARNQMVAFVGRSGSGKSTLLKTIIGLHERPDLPIGLGSLAFADTELKEWRQRFAYVDQSCTLFDMSIAENIALGRPGCSEEDIRRAAQEAGAAAFIDELPEGYASSCGERGASLSGGQKQRIAIARALVRQAPVLVFDEATSALDADSEQQIMRTIAELRRDHTVLITTHNLKEVADADLIVVMKDGSIAETGTHQELLERGGAYAELLRKAV